MRLPTFRILSRGSGKSGETDRFRAAAHETQVLLVDSNILIYAAQQRHPALRDLIEREAPAISVISMIETLGYHRLPSEEARFLKELFDSALILRLTDDVVERAILLRQDRAMSLGDSIIAATAMAYGLTLVTHNIDDFRHIEGLDLQDPLTAQ